MRLFWPTDTSGLLPITYVHAMAYAGVEGLLLVEPQQRFVSLGYFDDPRLVDLDFCQREGLPVMRRELGGGTVLLGPGQVFYLLVSSRSHGRIPGTVADAFRYLSRAPIAAYARLGVRVHYRPVTDLITEDNRKISGQGAADINGYFCYAGNILCDFDVETMQRVLRTENDRHRARVRAALLANMSWLGRECRQRPDTDTVIGALREAFAGLLGPFTEEPLPDQVVMLARLLETEMASAEALSLDDPRIHNAIKIREGVYVRYAQAHLAGSDVEIEIDISEDRITSARIQGKCPLPNINDDLRGIPFIRAAVSKALATVPLPVGITVESLTDLVVGRG